MSHDHAHERPSEGSPPERTPVADSQHDGATTKFRVPAMDCAAEKDVIASRLRRVAEVHHTNIALSIATKVVFFALALVGIATLWMAVFADMGASLLVAANGLRMLRA